MTGGLLFITAILVAFAVTILVSIIMLRAIDPGSKADDTPVSLAVKPKSGLRAALGTVHPFALDFRVGLAIVLALFAFLLGYYLFVPFSLLIGYFGGDLFMSPEIKDMLTRLQDMTQFATDLRSTLQSGSSSAAGAVQSAMLSQGSSLFIQSREECYSAFVDYNMTDANALDALRDSFRKDTNPFGRIVDFMVYLSTKRTDLHIAEQLGATGDILLQQLRLLQDVIVQDLLGVVNEIRLILIITLVSEYGIFAFDQHALTHDLGASIVAQLIAGVVTLIQIIWMYFTRRELTFSSRYF